MEGLGTVEVFQNSHHSLHFSCADFVFGTVLRALPLCPYMYPSVEPAWGPANDSQQQQVR